MDTNIWIYLSNGFNVLTNKYEENTHIKMLQFLKQNIQSQKTALLVAENIYDEWNRNKASTEKLIKILENRKKESKNQLKDVFEKLPEKKAELNLIIDEYTQKIDELISLNYNHISEVEDLLNNHVIKYPISNSTRIIASKQAERKLAPFKGDKSNSMADMLILLSGIEYIEKNLCIVPDFDLYPMNYFVSSNKNDYSSETDPNSIHDDLKLFLTKTNTNYRIHLGKLINEISDHLVFTEMELQEYDDNLADTEPCPFCDDYYGIIDFNEPSFSIRDKRYEFHDKKQLRFEFDTTPLDKLNQHALVEIKEGCCNYCGHVFVECGICGETIPIEYDENNVCKGCGAVYFPAVIQDRKGAIESIDYSIVKDSFACCACGEIFYYEDLDLEEGKEEYECDNCGELIGIQKH